MTGPFPHPGKGSAPTIRAVLFDLDDTLYPQQEWLAGAWRAVAAAAPQTADKGALLEALREVAAGGSDRGRIIDRALARAGVSADIDTLVTAFRAYAPRSLPPYPGAVAAVAALRLIVPVGLVTDGDPAIQRSKLAALELAESFDAVVLSDEMGREKRKPHPAPFLAALDLLGVGPDEAVFVGDRPDKDVAGASAAGIRAVRVLTGEYAHQVGGVRPWAEFASVAEAVTHLLEMIRLHRPPRS